MASLLSPIIGACKSMKFNIKKTSVKKENEILSKISKSAYNIDGETFKKYYVQAGGTKRLADHIWDKWKIEHKDNFLWAYGSLDKENRMLVTKALLKFAKERGY